MRYENEPCCGCGQVLQPETDDIVVCPDCGAPLHRSCWQETGACPHAAQHGEGFAWVSAAAEPEPELPAPEEEEPPGIICPTCGENCPPEAARCDNCGTDFEEFSNSLRVRFEQEQLRREQYMRENFPSYKVNGRYVTMGDTLAGQRVEEIALQLRGPNRSVGRYLSRFESNKKVGWNWAAFFLGPYWFFFRKLYKPALLFAGLVMALTLGFAPMTNNLNTAAFSEDFLQAQSFSAMMEALEDSVPDMQASIRENRWQLAVYGVLQLALHVGMALLADPLLRRKLWKNIDYVHQNEAIASDGAGQRFGQHQMLIRMGGFSLVAPLLYFWSLTLLPSFIIDLITWITS